jgi:hypothetical protein
MEKIIRQALTSAGFKNADAITEVIFATPNPTVASEMILGCHEPSLILSSFHRKGTSLYSIKGVDELRDIVSYERINQKTKTVYYLTKEDKENGVYQESYSNRDYYSSGSILVPGYTVINDQMNIAQWKNHGAEQISDSEFHNTILEWNYNPQEFAMV